MKTLFFCLLSFFCLQPCEAQKAVVANLKKNIVDVGYPNPLEILVEGYKCSEFDVTTNNGVIIKDDSNCSYVYTPERQGISRIIISTKNGSIISMIDFRAKFLQLDVAAEFCVSTRGVMYMQDLMRCNEIYTYVKGFDWDAGFRIQKYCVAIIRRDDTVFFCNDLIGNTLSKKLRQEFKKNIDHLDHLVFYGITAKGPDRRVLELSPLEFTITKK